MPNDDCGVCPLSDFASAEEFLRALLGASGQSLKEHVPDRRWLGSPLKRGQTVRLPLALVNRGLVWPGFEGPEPRILAEDPRFVALWKPPGVHTHPVAYEPAANLLSWLAREGRHDLLAVNPEGMDRGCLYRLDQGTSGLVLYAKDTALHRALRENFAGAFKRKLYLAVVGGEPGDVGELADGFLPHGPRGHMMKVVAPDSGNSRRGELRYRRLARNGEWSLLLVELKTGLRHQIRAQLAAAGCPLLGDALYGGAAHPRLQLHCWRYDLVWEGHTFTWEAPPDGLGDGLFGLHRLLQMVHDELG